MFENVDASREVVSKRCPAIPSGSCDFLGLIWSQNTLWRVGSSLHFHRALSLYSSSFLRHFASQPLSFFPQRGPVSVPSLFQRGNKLHVARVSSFVPRIYVFRRQLDESSPR